MCKRNLVTMIASMTAVILATGAAANETVYNFTFDSPSESIIGQLTVDASNNEVTDITGTLSGIVNDTISGFLASPSFANTVSLPGDVFIYDNVFYPDQASLVDVYGVAFTTAGNAGGYWNLWSGAPGDYSLDEFERRRRFSDHHRRRKPGSNGSSPAFDLGDDADGPGRHRFRGLPPWSEGPSRADVRIVSRRVDTLKGRPGAFLSPGHRFCSFCPMHGLPTTLGRIDASNGRYLRIAAIHCAIFERLPAQAPN